MKAQRLLDEGQLADAGRGSALASIAGERDLGAAWLAGSGAGVWPGEEGFAKSWRREKRFAPAMEAGTRSRLVAGWRDAVDRTRTT